MAGTKVRSSGGLIWERGCGVVVVEKGMELRDVWEVSQKEGLGHCT